MEFWGVEVKPGQSLKVEPEIEKLIHISQASLGEVKDVKGAKKVHLRMKIDGKDFVIGTLSGEDRTQLMFDLVFEREFELSHDCKHGSVYFIGYMADDPAEDGDDFSDEFDDESEDEPLVAHVTQANAYVTQANGVIKPKSLDVKSAKSSGSVKAEIKKDDQPGLEDADEESDSDDEMPLHGLQQDDSDDVSGEDDDDEDEDDEELPKVQPTKKRPAQSPQKTPFSAKKAKSATPAKTGNKVHAATPFPSKAAGKTPASNNSKKKSPKFGGKQFKAKHGGK